MQNFLKKSFSMIALSALVLSTAPTSFVGAATMINDGDLVKVANDSAIYFIQNGTKRVIPHSAVYHSWGFPSNFSSVKSVTSSELAAYTTGDALPFRDGYMFRGTSANIAGFASEAVFFVSDGKIRPIESANTYMKLVNNGVYDSKAWNRVTWVPNDLLSKFAYPASSVVKESDVDAGNLPNGMLVKGATDGLVYVIRDGKLANVTSTAFQANRFQTAAVITVAQSKIQNIAVGAPVTAVDSTLLTPAKLTGTTTTTEVATKVMLASDVSTVSADGSVAVNLTASIQSASGATVANNTSAVTFAITSGSGLFSATVVNAVAGVATTKFTPQASATAGTITITASVNGLTAGSVMISTLASTNMPQVVSTTNSGMRIVNVAFDKALDKTSAETTTNYTVKNNKSSTVTVTAAKLLADNKTVQLFLNSNGMFNDSIEDSIEVKNVQDVAQLNTVATITKAFTMSDTTVPSVVSVEALGSKAVRVTFSEAIQNVAGYGSLASGTGAVYSAFRLDDKVLRTDTTSTLTGFSGSYIDSALVSYPDAGDYTKALISFASPVTVGVHTLIVSNNGIITDYNVTTDGTTNVNVMQPAGYVATVVSDATVPTLSSVEVLTQTKVRYTFSKSVNTPTANAFFWSTAANQTSGTFATSVTKVSDTVFEATWGTAINTGTIYFYAGTNNSTDKVTDFSGNAISPLPSSKMLTVSTDTAPSLSSASMDTDSDKIVLVYFNKDVETASATNSSNYVFKKADGTILTSTTGGNAINGNGNPSGTISFPDAANKKKIKIDLGTADANALPGGSYQVTVTGVKTLGGTTAMNAQSYNFTVTDKTRPSLKNNPSSGFGTSVTASTNRIVVNYTEAMGTSATDAQNYKITNSNNFAGTPSWIKLSDLSGVTLGFRNANKDVVIDFPTSMTLTTGYGLMIGYIDGSVTRTPTDVMGNLFRDYTTNASLSAAITVSAARLELGYGYGIGYGALANSTYGYATGITNIKVTSVTTMEVTFTRDLDTVNASEFLITSKANAVGMTPTSATIKNDDNKNVVVFTIPSGSANEFTSSDNGAEVSIRTANSSLYGYGTTTTKDALGLTLFTLTKNAGTGATYATDATNSAVTYKNDIRPIVKSWVFNSPTQIAIAFDGKIEQSGSNLTTLGSNLILTQVSGTTTTTASGSDITDASVTTTDSTVVVLTLSKSFDTNTKAILKTVGDGSIIAIGANGARISANTTGMENSGFVATGITQFGYSTTSYAGLTAYGSGYGYGIIVTFNNNVDASSIVSGWTDGKTTKSVTSSAIVDANGITFSGATLGQFKATGLTAGTYNVTYTFIDTNVATKTLFIELPTNIWAGNNGTVSYEPTSIKDTNSPANVINADFKPAK